MSFVAEVNDQFVGFALAYLTYVREQISEACVIQIFGVKIPATRYRYQTHPGARGEMSLQKDKTCPCDD